MTSETMTPENMTPRIAFFGGKPLSARCLMLLHEYQVRGQAEIVAVLPRAKGLPGWWSGPGVREMAETAEELGLPCIDQATELKGMDVDLGISVLHGSILPRDVFDHPRFGFLNLHGAPLPAYRGCNVCTFAILNGERDFGVTLHQIDEKPDHGNILAICRFAVAPDETSRSLMAKADHAGFHLFERMLPDILENIRRGDYEAQAGKPQSELLAEEHADAKYYRRDAVHQEGFKQVRLDWPADRIDRVVRALDFPPFEPAFAMVNGRKVYLTSSHQGSKPVVASTPGDLRIDMFCGPSSVATS